MRRSNLFLLGPPIMLFQYLTVVAAVSAPVDGDALALLQSDVRAGFQLNNAQPEYARPHKHSWEKAKDKLIAAGTFVDNFLKGAKQQANDTVNGYLQNASRFVDSFLNKAKKHTDDTVNGYFENATREAARSWRSGLAMLVEPTKANLTSVADKISSLSARNCSQSAGGAQAGLMLYRVDNSRLNAETHGIGYRFSKRISDRDMKSIARWGSTVAGHEEGDDWLRVGECFLPMQLKGVPVLTPSGHVTTAPGL
mmetsp:Transcript_110891/g.324404  ORF Transcript_110891/g.324404 Transcript_110891/m.324404 type:complete len:253 (-) Transcript_110891:95-853(-)